MKCAWHLPLVAAMPLLGSCYHSTEDFKRYLDDRDAPRLAVQICIPDRTAFFDEERVDITDFPEGISILEVNDMLLEAESRRTHTNPHKSNSSAREFAPVLRWRAPTDGNFPRKWILLSKAAHEMDVVSYGGGHAELAGSTQTNQAVLYGYTHVRPGDVIAISIALPMRRGGDVETREFWYKLPRELPRSGYSTWMNAASEEGPGQQPERRSTFYRLTHGEEMPVFKVGDNAPRIRYALLSLEQYYKQPRTEYRALSAARMRYTMQGVSIQDEHFHLAVPIAERIPPC
jgi:hypothetical protein